MQHEKHETIMDKTTQSSTATTTSIHKVEITPLNMKNMKQFQKEMWKSKPWYASFIS